MKVLITGAGGQLGTDLTVLLQRNPERYQVFPLTRSELDITKQEQVEKTLQTIRPDIVIHCAAYTNVDQAEIDSDQAYKVNALATRFLATAVEQNQAKLVYLSTDYVFDGIKNKPYHEDDIPNPLNIYGQTKLAGEKFVQSISTRYFIVRTSWVYGQHGPNFVKTMLSLAQNHQELDVVNDQVGSPTYSVDLAQFLQILIKTDYYGIFHATNSGQCSWYEFAKAIFEESGADISVNPCKTTEFPRPAHRPALSVLEHRAIRLHALSDLRPWREALRDYLSPANQSKQ
ncbi:Spore coat polysaccharide biosynthesis protein SpsK [Candidatus Desulfosporosinus infrequens]|uniref:dTDP-4-dehydrorhamnose reductase n=1 Tax=Candidatus Desulfosporosinus infrequens TaxID=2043169 RepID=A0A2U3LV51_9FIRM|nr:Spore coat polysaccharide biosynthesis protein SpsK [Candidatus Desulfosporosinus infrequens]